jgi:hypothetical protein
VKRRTPPLAFRAMEGVVKWWVMRRTPPLAFQVMEVVGEEKNPPARISSDGGGGEVVGDGKNSSARISSDRGGGG